MPSEFSGQVPFFFQSFLGKPASALPKGAQWILSFEGAFSASKGSLDYSEVLPVAAIKKAVAVEPRKWSIDSALETMLEKDYQQTKGCLFAQAVTMVSESNVANPEGLQFNGFLRTAVGAGRNSYNGLQVSFLETNVSFVDNVIRPWVIATSRLGLIARQGEDNYRCNMSLYKIGVVSPDQSPFVLQKYTYYGCCPTEVTGEVYEYTSTTSPVRREATFTFHYYNIETGENNAAINNNNSSLPVAMATSEREVSTL